MIRESGWYPPGAEFDPNAPWNQKDDECTCDTEPDKDCPLHSDEVDADILRDRQIDDKLTGDA